MYTTPFVNSHVLILVALAVTVNPESSASKYVEGHPSPEETMQLWKQILRSFKIVDFGLFGA